MEKRNGVSIFATVLLAIVAVLGTALYFVTGHSIPSSLPSNPSPAQIGTSPSSSVSAPTATAPMPQYGYPSQVSTTASSPQVKIRDATFSAGAKAITMDLVNTGAAGDTLSSVTVNMVGYTLASTAFVPNGTINPNSTTNIVITMGGGAMPAVGQQVTFTALTSSGQSYTFSVVVSA